MSETSDSDESRTTSGIKPLFLSCRKKTIFPLPASSCASPNNARLSAFFLFLRTRGVNKGGRAHQTHPLSVGYRSEQLFAKGKRDYSNPCILRTNADRNTPSCKKRGCLARPVSGVKQKSGTISHHHRLPIFSEGWKMNSSPLKPGENTANGIRFQ